MSYQDTAEGKEYKRSWAIENKERISLLAAQRYQKNRIEFLERAKRYASENKQKIKEYRQTYGKENREHINAYRRRNWVKDYANNREKYIIKAKQYYLNNREEKKQYNQIYYKNNKATINKRAAKYQANRKKNDVEFKLQHVLRNRLLKALRTNQKRGSPIRDLGCTIPELKFYLEGQFQDGMTWNNHGVRGWHIDHKIPLSFFDLTEREQFLQACHYTNLQPMWAKENLQKHAKLPQGSVKAQPKD